MMLANRINFYFKTVLWQNVVEMLTHIWLACLKSVLVFLLLFKFFIREVMIPILQDSIAYFFDGIIFLCHTRFKWGICND